MTILTSLYIHAITQISQVQFGGSVAEVAFIRYLDVVAAETRGNRLKSRILRKHPAVNNQSQINGTRGTSRIYIFEPPLYSK